LESGRKETPVQTVKHTCHQLHHPGTLTAKRTVSALEMENGSISLQYLLKTPGIEQPSKNKVLSI